MIISLSMITIILRPALQKKRLLRSDFEGRHTYLCYQSILNLAKAGKYGIPKR